MKQQDKSDGNVGFAAYVVRGISKVKNYYAIKTR